MDAKQAVAEEIGRLVISNIERQSHIVATTNAAAETAKLLATLILSGKVNEEVVPDLLKTVPGLDAEIKARTPTDLP